MDIFFQDPSEIPLPPEEVRIRSLRAEPWPDGRRVRIYLEVDPFQKRPSAEVTVTDPQGTPAAQASVIESMTRKIEFNMHLRQAQLSGRYTVSVVLFYSDPIPEPRSSEEQTAELPSLPEQKMVDRAETTFTVETT